MSRQPKHVITIAVTDTVYQLLRVLGPTNVDDDVAVQSVVELLIDHAQQGVYRPGSWERGWLAHVFFEDWTDRLEPGDPHGREGLGHVFQRPRRRSS